MPSSLVHSQLLSWQQWQAGDTGSIIVTLVSTQQTHKGGTGYTKDCFTLCHQTEFICAALLVYLHPIIVDGPVRKRGVILPAVYPFYFNMVYKHRLYK